MSADDFPPAASNRPVWLITLADLALLLIGFFVLLQATRPAERPALAAGLRQGFGIGGGVPVAPPPEAPLPLAAFALTGFGPGSSVLPEPPGRLIAWARDAAADPRVVLAITGSTDASARDVDPDSGSAALLAADRARAVAALLARAGIAEGDRISIATASTPGQRRVLITLGFAGGTVPADDAALPPAPLLPRSTGGTQ